MRQTTTTACIALLAMLTTGVLAGTAQAVEPALPDPDKYTSYVARLTEDGERILANTQDYQVIPSSYCPQQEAPENGPPGRYYRWCVYDNTQTGQMGFLCWTEELTFGEGNPQYHGEQSCFLAMEDDASMICFGYHWEYHNVGGEKSGDKDSFSCEGLPIIATVER